MTHGGKHQILRDYKTVQQRALARILVLQAKLIKFGVREVNPRGKNYLIFLLSLKLISMLS